MLNRIAKLTVMSLSFIATASVMYSQAKQPVPNAIEILELAGNALGGDAFFNPKPYRIILSSTSHDSYDGKKTVNRVDTYKNGKYHIDATILIKRIGQPFYMKSITDMAKAETWEWFSSEKGGYQKAKDGVQSPVIPFTKKSSWKEMIFDLVNVIVQDGKEYYKLEAKYSKPERRDLRVTYLIDTGTYLVYKIETINIKKSYKFSRTIMSYARVQDIMIPKKYTTESTDVNGGKFYYEYNISQFEFADDIPDSLFVVPKK